MKARAFWIVAPGQSELRDESLVEPGPGQLLIETRYSAISRGTEALVFHGRVPKSEQERMRCPHQGGNFPGPVKYGYSNVGVVVRGPGPWLGQSVFCLYPHQTHYVVDQADVFPLPREVPPERALLLPISRPR